MRIWMLGVVVVAGCAATEPQPISGDRSAGLIRFSAEQFTSAFTDPDWSAAHEQAVERCKSWGYSGAEPFAAACSRRNLLGTCEDRVMVRDYQCLD